MWERWVRAVGGHSGHPHFSDALVMEMVEGKTLSGPLPVTTALDYARQIAGAFEAAHEKGIIHRDLKPANVKVTPEGVVKVLNFGLATIPQLNRDEAVIDPHNSPTLTLGASQTGVIMGTAAYMSPEQAAGKAVDKRCDSSDRHHCSDRGIRMVARHAAARTSVDALHGRSQRRSRS